MTKIELDPGRHLVADDEIPYNYMSFWNHGFHLGTYARGSHEGRMLSESRSFDEVRMCSIMCAEFQVLRNRRYLARKAQEDGCVRYH